MSTQGPPSEPPPIEWFASGLIPRQKLEDYLLSPDHPVGRNKFRLWNSVFGFEEDDAELLEHLLREQLTQATPEERPGKFVEEPECMVREWEVVIPRFQGPNGEVGPVLTGWAFDPAISVDAPRLSTAQPVVD